MSINAALVQFKPRKGDVAANLATMREIFAQLIAAGPIDLIVFPEAALTGYFLEGAVYELAFDTATMAAMIDAQWRAAGGTRPVDVVVGFYENASGTFHNSAIYLRCGGEDVHVVHVHRKMFLPTYGVFDEERFLTRGRRLSVFETPFGKAAILICEDAWHALMPTVAALKGAKVLIIPSASPARGLGGDGELESTTRWKAILSSAAAEHGVYVLYAGLTGFEGGKGMGGATCAFSPRGDLLQALGPLDPGIVRLTLREDEIDLARAAIPLLGDLSAVLPDLWLDDEIPVTYRLEERA